MIDSFVRAPNFNERSCDVSMLVLHYTGMQDGQSALERLCAADSGVSAHYLVWEDGRIVSLVPEHKRAWHAGVAHWRGLVDVNSASVGIEIVNSGHDGGLPDFPDAQIQAVVSLARDSIDRHRIEARNIVGHSDIAPGRKQDPGEKFPWRRLAEAGIGFWPSGPVGSVSDRRPERVRRALTQIGYDPSVDLEAVLGAFQRRWRPGGVSGQADDETTGLIEAVAEFSVG